LSFLDFRGILVFFMLTEVYNRGIGAYVSNPRSVRMKGSFKKGVNAPMSKKLSKQQWAMARVYSFINGNPKHDTDLSAMNGSGNACSGGPGATVYPDESAQQNEAAAGEEEEEEAEDLDELQGEYEAELDEEEEEPPPPPSPPPPPPPPPAPPAAVVFVLACLLYQRWGIPGSARYIPGLFLNDTQFIFYFGIRNGLSNDEIKKYMALGMEEFYSGRRGPPTEPIYNQTEYGPILTNPSAFSAYTRSWIANNFP